MAWRLFQFKYEARKPPTVHKEISLSKLQLRFPRRLLARQLILSVFLVAIPVWAFRLDIDIGLKWFALIFSVFFALLSLFALGVQTDGDRSSLDAVKYYGRGMVIFFGILWVVLIGGMAYFLFVVFPPR